MTLQPHDDRAERWRARYESYAGWFAAGEISADVFRAGLYALGFRGQEIETEIALHQGARP